MKTTHFDVALFPINYVIMSRKFRHNRVKRLEKLELENLTADAAAKPVFETSRCDELASRWEELIDVEASRVKPKNEERRLALSGLKSLE
jgi:hypothetical protein